MKGEWQPKYTLASTQIHFKLKILIGLFQNGYEYLTKSNAPIEINLHFHTYFLIEVLSLMDF